MPDTPIWSMVNTAADGSLRIPVATGPNAGNNGYISVDQLAAHVASYLVTNNTSPLKPIVAHGVFGSEQVLTMDGGYHPLNVSSPIYDPSGVCNAGGGYITIPATGQYLFYYRTQIDNLNEPHSGAAIDMEFGFAVGTDDYQCTPVTAVQAVGYAGTAAWNTGARNYPSLTALVNAPAGTHIRPWYHGVGTNGYKATLSGGNSVFWFVRVG